MEFSFKQIPGDIFDYITSYLHTPDLFSFDQVEMCIHQRLQDKKYWLRRIEAGSLPDLKKYARRADPQYEIKIGVDNFSFKIIDYNLDVIKGGIIAYRLYNLNHQGTQEGCASLSLRRMPIQYSSCKWERSVINKHCSDSSREDVICLQTSSWYRSMSLQPAQYKLYVKDTTPIMLTSVLKTLTSLGLRDVKIASR